MSFGSIYVEGEVSNLRIQSNGHAYFSLKDENSQVFCAFFRSGKIDWSDGILLQVKAKMSFYPARGSAQLIVSSVKKAGEGALQKKFENLKKLLREEGLFDSDKKSSLPPYPQKVGIISSANGAALKDIYQVLERRSPWIQTFLYPVLVQGEGAWREIIQAIERFNSPEQETFPKVDVLLLARGGGSLEDLWNFNNEDLARSISVSEIPIISGIGHETDFTLVDFVSDVRAPTPSAAAEMLSPSKEEIKKELSSLLSQADAVVEKKWFFERKRLEVCLQCLRIFSPFEILKRRKERLSEIQFRILQNMGHFLDREKSRIQGYKNSLDLLHPRHQIPLHQKKLEYLKSLLSAFEPFKVLERGFALIFDKKGKLVSASNQVEKNSVFTVQFSDGAFEFVAKKKKKSLPLFERKKKN